MIESLEDKIRAAGGPVRMLRTLPAVHYPFWYPTEWTTWFNEQSAWRDSAVLFDQSHHMSDVHFTGPDVKRLLSDTGINSPATLGRNRAKQFVACGYDGRFIGDAILFGLEDDEYSLVGGPLAANWVAFQAQHGGYDVEVTRDDATLFNPTGRRRVWRYQLNGPRTQGIIEKAVGGPVEHIKFFRMGELQIAGTPVRVLNHTMSGVPGRDYTGLELWGPAEHGQRVLDTLLEAGVEFGLRRGGAISYLSSGHESGWIPVMVPAIYNQDEMKPYREYLPGFSAEGALPLEGSFVSDDIEDYYVYPWDLGYGSLLRFDHDFIGRSALEERADAPHRRKVWLHWNGEDVARVWCDSLFGTGDRPKIISIPNLNPATTYYDTVLKDDRPIGVSTWGGYTVNIRRVVTLAVIDEAEARDGADVEVVWGEPDGGAGRALSEPHHAQTSIRATINTRPPA
jgi:vanillate/3-O-methylgallate O-demethylase